MNDYKFLSGIALVLIALFTTTCSKQEDMRNIRRLNPTFKSYVPDLNEEFKRIKFYSQDTWYTMQIYYKSGFDIQLTNDPCPNSYECTYNEYFTTTMFVSGSSFLTMNVFEGQQGTLPYIEVGGGWDRTRIFLQENYSDYIEEITKLGDYELNGKVYHDVVKVQSTNVNGVEFYYNRTEGIIKRHNSVVNEGYELI